MRAMCAEEIVWQEPEKSNTVSPNLPNTILEWRKWFYGMYCCKRQIVGTEYVWKTKNKPVPKNFKEILSAGKVMLIAFWDCCGLLIAMYSPQAKISTWALILTRCSTCRPKLRKMVRVYCQKCYSFSLTMPTPTPCA